MTLQIQNTIHTICPEAAKYLCLSEGKKLGYYVNEGSFYLFNVVKPLPGALPKTGYEVSLKNGVWTYNVNLSMVSTLLAHSLKKFNPSNTYEFKLNTTGFFLWDEQLGKASQERFLSITL